VSESIYVIYKDGHRLTKDEAGMNVKIAYLKKGAANGVVTSLVNDYVSYELDISKYYQKEKWDQEEKKERSRYEVKEYIPKEVKND
jgi:hypothetical protein